MPIASIFCAWRSCALDVAVIGNVVADTGGADDRAVGSEQQGVVPHDGAHRPVALDDPALDMSRQVPGRDPAAEHLPGAAAIILGDRAQTSPRR